MSSLSCVCTHDKSPENLCSCWLVCHQCGLSTWVCVHVRMCLCVHHVFLICRVRLEPLAASLGHICLSDIVQSSCCSTKMLHLICINNMMKKEDLDYKIKMNTQWLMSMLGTLVFCSFLWPHLPFPHKITAQHKSELRHHTACLFGMHFILATHHCSNTNTSQNACMICALVVISQ